MLTSARSIPAGLVVADRLMDGVDVLLVDADPSPCRAARLVALTSPVKVVLAVPDEIDLLPVAVSALDAGLRTVGNVVVEQASKLPALTDAEIALLSAVAAGESNDALAARFGTSPSTVKRLLARLRVRLGVESRHELQQLAAGFVLDGARFDPC